ncbi:glycosyltransferase family 2 protein [Microbacterium gilvum]|uniref:Glycosyltransferase 2-like domain-containing protein n=1 Tax=Microbacterium gilvum TaxID=1336204 RepID=A0ABP8ZYP3_9MICO
MPVVPDLSVVVPAGDAGGRLGAVLHALRGQTLDGIEVLVVADSTSGTELADVAEAVTADARVRLIVADRSPRGAGLAAACGRRVAFIRDEVPPPDAFAALVDALDRAGADVAVRGRAGEGPPAPVRTATLAREPALVTRRTCGLVVFDTAWLRATDEGSRGPLAAGLGLLAAARRVAVVPGLDHRCPAGRTPLSEYLRDERECAKLVGDLGAPALARAYGGHVREHEAFLRIARFAEAGADDDDVRSALRALLDVLPEGEVGGDPLRALVIGLVARRRTAAARPLAHWLLDEVSDPAAQVRDWAQSLATMEESELLWPEARVELAPAVIAALRAHVPIDAAGSWRALVDEARRVLPDDALVLVPEAATHPALAARALSARALVDGCVQRVARAGRMVVVEGRSAVGGDRAVPVLHGAGGEVSAASVDWVPERVGGWHWSASYPLRSLPLERTLTPALSVALEGFAVAIDGEGEMPRTRRRDPLMCDRVDGATALRRRRHWLVRAARDAAAVIRMRAASVRGAIADLRDRVLVR